MFKSSSDENMIFLINFEILIARAIKHVKTILTNKANKSSTIFLTDYCFRNFVRQSVLLTWN